MHRRGRPPKRHAGLQCPFTLDLEVRTIYVSGGALGLLVGLQPQEVASAPSVETARWPDG